MKNIAKILIPLAVLSLSSCRTVQEGAIYKTRKYIWEVQFYQEMARTKWSDPKRTFVVTDSVSFVIEGLPKIPLKSESYSHKPKSINIFLGKILKNYTDCLKNEILE